MADPLQLPRIRGNVEKMIGAGAPAHDIDDYLASEGYTKDTFRAAVKGGPLPNEPKERGLVERAVDFIGDQAGWQRTRAINAGTGMAGQNPVVDPVKRVVGGTDWRKVADAAGPSAPISAQVLASLQAPADFGAGGGSMVGGGGVQPASTLDRTLKYAFPDTQTQREVINAIGIQPVDTPNYLGGKVTDAAVEAVIAGRAFPGTTPRSMAPAAAGGALSERAGQLTEGTMLEAPARLAGAAAGGYAASQAQRPFIAAKQGAVNVLGGKGGVDDTAGRIISRAIERDKTTPQNVLNRARDLGDDATLADAGGENVKGALRGSIAAPGQARTTVRNALQDRAEGERGRVSASINRNVSPKGLTQTVDDFVAERNTAPKPLYEKAFTFNGGQAWSPRVQQFLDDPLFKPALARGIEIQRIESLAKGTPFDPKAYGITGFADDGAPIITGTPNMRALNAAKKGIDAIIEGYRDKTTGRVVLDEKGRAIDMARAAFVKELDTLNPEYAAARRAYAEPSQLKDAAEKGARLFASNERPDVIKREFAKLTTADEKEAFRIGVAEHLRSIVGRRDASNAAARVVPGPDARNRLVAVLGEKEAKAILADLAREKTFTSTMRDVGVGSRTTPMGLEAQDNAGQAASALVDAARGNFRNALSAATSRLTEGRTEAVNARVAEILTSMKPEDQMAFVKALEQSLARQRLGAPRNAFLSGTAAALPDALRERR